MCNIGHAWTWHYISQKTPCVEIPFTVILFDIMKDSLYMMYSLYLHIGCSAYLVIFMAHEGSREALNFP